MERLLLVKALVTVLRPPEIHFLIMILDEIGNFGYFPIIENATILNNRIAVALNKELSRPSLSELTVAGMYVHTLHHTEGCKI
jgi:hypothetical protein